MRIPLALVSAILFVGAIVAFASRTPVLSAAECQTVTGSVNNYFCNDTASCDIYNAWNFGMPICPGVQFCETCEFTGDLWQTCVSRTGYNCTELGEVNDCGRSYNGVCNGSTCTNLVWFGPYCVDAPGCSSP